MESNSSANHCRQGGVSPTLCCISRVFSLFCPFSTAQVDSAETPREHRLNPVSAGCTLTASLTALQCWVPPLMHRRAVLFMQRRWGDWGILPGCCLFHNTNWIESQLFWFDLLFVEANTATGALGFLLEAWRLKVRAVSYFFPSFIYFKCLLLRLDCGKWRRAAAGAPALTVIFLSLLLLPETELWISMKNLVYRLYPNCFPFLKEILFFVFSIINEVRL